MHSIKDSFISVSWNRPHEGQPVEDGYVEITEPTQIAALLATLRARAKILDLHVNLVRGGKTKSVLTQREGYPQNLETKITQALSELFGSTVIKTLATAVA
jgi:hypothetical protein